MHCHQPIRRSGSDGPDLRRVDGARPDRWHRRQLHARCHADQGRQRQCRWHGVVPAGHPHPRDTDRHAADLARHRLDARHSAISGVETGATPVCTVTGPSTVPDPTCGSIDNARPVRGRQGHLHVDCLSQDAAGKDSAPASATYEFEGGAPARPVVTAPSSPSQSRSPTFTVTDSDPVDLTYNCTVTGPSPVTTSECGPTTRSRCRVPQMAPMSCRSSPIDGVGHTSPAGTPATSWTRRHLPRRP